eukprot:10265022-Heterocapsa_arctica.AAC.1
MWCAWKGAAPSAPFTADVRRGATLLEQYRSFCACLTALATRLVNWLMELRAWIGALGARSTHCCTSVT